MQKVDRVFVNVNPDGEIIHNQCFVEVNDEMSKNHRFKNKLFFPGVLTDKELITLDDQIIISSRNGVFSSNKIEKALIQDVFIFNKGFDKIQKMDVDKICELLNGNEKEINIRIRLQFNSNFEFDQPVLIGYNNPNSRYRLNWIDSRGPFDTITDGKTYFEIYPTTKNLNRSYVFNMRYTLSK